METLRSIVETPEHAMLSRDAGATQCYRVIDGNIEFSLA